MSPHAGDEAAGRLWLLVREQVASTAARREDERRLKSALAKRRSKSQQFFARSAAQWDRLRGELFGERFHLSALAALASPEWVAGDLGCGTGQVSAVLAPFVSQVIGVDSSAEMLQAAQDRLVEHPNIQLRRGDLEALPIDDATLDLATLMLVLHHVAVPQRALAEIARVLKPGGRLLLVDMLPHDRENYRQQMGHVWLGFPEESISRMAVDAGLGNIRVVALPADRTAKGPGLFVASATRVRS
jgi:ArsR family transcriptional regulator